MSERKNFVEMQDIMLKHSFFKDIEKHFENSTEEVRSETFDILVSKLKEALNLNEERSVKRARTDEDMSFENCSKCDGAGTVYKSDKTILDLNDDILEQVLSYLSQQELVVKASLVCKRFHDVSQRPGLWRTLCIDIPQPEGNVNKLVMARGDCVKTLTFKADCFTQRARLDVHSVFARLLNVRSTFRQLQDLSITCYLPPELFKALEETDIHLQTFTAHQIFTLPIDLVDRTAKCFDNLKYLELCNTDHQFLNLSWGASSLALTKFKFHHVQELAVASEPLSRVIENCSSTLQVLSIHIGKPFRYCPHVWVSPYSLESCLGLEELEILHLDLSNFCYHTSLKRLKILRFSGREIVRSFPHLPRLQVLVVHSFLKKKTVSRLARKCPNLRRFSSHVGPDFTHFQVLDRKELEWRRAKL
jgi:hypothetical protein